MTASAICGVNDPSNYCSITDTYDYNAFGNKINSTGTTPNNYLYRGEQFDADLGLYYLRARYYNPLTGRFMSRDPLDDDSTDTLTQNKYLYAEGNPVDRFDPSGQDSVEYAIALQPAKLSATGAIIAGTAGLALGSGSYAVTAAILCHFYTDASALDAISQHVGLLQTVTFYASGCYASSNGTGPQAGPGSELGPVTGPSGAPSTPPGREPPPPPKKCTEQHPDWPVNYVHYSTTPLIAAHVAVAQAPGWPDGLTYLGPNNPLQQVNRDAACPRGKYRGMSCDEYPYASTAQGGAGASTAPVPIREQWVQGGELGRFYGTIAPDENFCVEVGP